MPNVLQWLSARLNCSSQVASLLAATASGDVEVVRGIIKNNPDLGLYNIQGGRSALTVAAERGDLEVLEIVYEGAVRARGESFAKQNLSAGAERGQTPLMRSCTYGTAQHVQCIGYLLRKGADPFSETDKGETCLHLAAKNAYTECLSEILAHSVSIGGGAPTLLADAVLPYTPPVKFVNMRNAAGFTPLHLATLKNSPAAMEVLLRAGASMDAGISDAGNTPHLAKGSTALHIAAARGSQPCCGVLLDFQAGVPGMDLRRIRNQRGLKASQLARLAGHDGLALILSERQSQGRPSRRSARRRRRTNRDALHTQGGVSRPTSSPDAVLTLLVQRAKLLLALREVGLELDAEVLQEDGLEVVKAAKLPNPKDDGGDVRDAKDEVAAAVAEFTELWKKGELEVASNKTGTLMSSLIPADMPVAKLPDEILGESKNGEDSYAAAAMVQAALNAMAYFSPVAKPLDLPPTELKPTSPIAAAMVVQAAIRKLAGKGGRDSTSRTTLLHSTAHLPPLQPADTESAADSAPVVQGAATPQQSEHRPRPRPNGAANPLRPVRLPGRESADIDSSDRMLDQPDEQVRRILSKARRRQRRNALRSIEVAALETTGAETPFVETFGDTHAQETSGDTPAQETSARSSDEQSLGPNLLMDNPLFPVSDEAMGPGERRRAALRQAALRTAPAGPNADEMQASSSGSTASQQQQGGQHALLQNTVPDPPSPYNTVGELPPAFPWEAVTASDSRTPPTTPFPFSNHMPSKLHRGGAAAPVVIKTPPKQTTRPAATPRTSSDSLPTPAGTMSPKASRPSNTSHDVACSMHSLTESAGSDRRRCRPDPSDAHSIQSGTTPGSRGSRLTRTDSSEDSAAATPSHTPHVTSPQDSEILFSQGTETCSDSERDDDDLDSDMEAKDDMELLKNGEAHESRCAICMDQPLQVGISTCDHKVCYGCAYQLCSRGLSAPICPFCRGAIVTFTSTCTDKMGHRDASQTAGHVHV